MKSDATHRDSFIHSVTHLSSAATNVLSNCGQGKALTFPDAQKISEGLFLSAVTHWEEFCRDLMVLDLSTRTEGVLRKDVKEFKQAGSPLRLAELLLSHVDHPDAFYDWSDFHKLTKRADRFLGTGHRFALPAATTTKLTYFKRIRNAVAHKTDKAHDSFMSLIKGSPFFLSPNQRKGITAGRFLCNNKWGGSVVLHLSLIHISEPTRPY